ncbi:MAG: hypothetical protein HXY43_06755 [Fischerella sp.]|uniref:hypothetical protein n=1 Tax=Fischerella sp. TaxID=1191 RepID=UPI0017C229DE|nr:hypothetical protein [Fischerella sp.]NWF58999.1 hypothetical protein [Fischerella sp.]
MKIKVGLRSHLSSPNFIKLWLGLTTPQAGQVERTSRAVVQLPRFYPESAIKF